MSESWSLVVPVLVVGLGLGLAWVVWWRGRGSGGGSEGRDQELRVADLQSRQAELYGQLRQATDEERPALELAAARNLKKLEEAGATTPVVAEEAPASRDDAQPEQPLRPLHRGPSATLGFLGGVACAGLIGVLILWAQRDAAPRPDENQAPMASRPADHPEAPVMDPQQAAALEDLARQVEEDPTDLMARKQYAVGLLSTGQFFPAFEQAEILLASNPDDPDGLYVAGMVRMRMGQEEVSRELLDRLVVDYPDHVPALTALGVLAIRDGGMDAAEVFWQRALAASGGSNPEVERLIATARSQFGDAAPRSAASATPAPPIVATEPPSSGPNYRLTIDFPDAGSGPEPGVLFVFLRQGEVGPPAAVKRIERPRFPITLTLGTADSMLGRPLPDSGTVVARLDADGSASTREDDEPTAETTMRSGEEARLTLQ